MVLIAVGGFEYQPVGFVYLLRVSQKGNSGPTQVAAEDDLLAGMGQFDPSPNREYGLRP